jgi:two-component system, OmpR family, response regulator
MRVVVVEDEPRLNELVVDYLGECGISAIGFPDGESGLLAAHEPGVDAMVLDLMLPGMGGLAVCRELRRGGSDLPVLILTARGAVSERVAGLDAGADDYLVKPFALEELAARLRAIGRRRERPTDRLIVGDLVLDVAEQRVWRGDVELEMSRREFAMLAALMDNAGRVVSRSYLLDSVWDGEIDIRSNAIDVHISKLRAIIDRPFGTVTITTLRGVGYRLERSL